MKKSFLRILKKSSMKFRVPVALMITVCTFVKPQLSVAQFVEIAEVTQEAQVTKKVPEKQKETENIDDCQKKNEDEARVDTAVMEDIDNLLSGGSCREFSLAGRKIGDNRVKNLAETLKTNTTLTTLDLSGNLIGDAGAKDLAEALEKNTTLQILNLRDNNIGDDGAKELARMLKTNMTLTNLYWFSNQIRKEGAEALVQAWKERKSLSKKNSSGNPEEVSSIVCETIFANSVQYGESIQPQIKRDLKESLGSFGQLNEESCEKICQLEKENNKLKVKVTELEQIVQSAEKKVKEERERADKAEKDLEETEKRNAELADKLKKVNARIEELDKTMKQLGEDKKAVEYESFAKDDRIRQLISELEAAKNETEAANVAKADAERKLDELKKKISELESELKGREEKAQEEQKQAAERVKKAEEAQKDADDAARVTNERAKQAKADKAEAIAQKEQLEKQSFDKDDRICQLERELKAAKDETEAANIAKADMERKLKKEQAKSAEQVEKAEKAQGAADEAARVANEQAKQAKADKAEAIAQKEQLEKQSFDKDDRIYQLEGDLKAARDEIEAANVAKADMERQLEGEKAKSAELEKKRIELKDKLAVKQSGLVKQKAKVSALKEAKAEAEEQVKVVERNLEIAEHVGQAVEEQVNETKTVKQKELVEVKPEMVILKKQKERSEASVGIENKSSEPEVKTVEITKQAEADKETIQAKVKSECKNEIQTPKNSVRKYLRENASSIRPPRFKKRKMKKNNVELTAFVLESVCLDVEDISANFALNEEAKRVAKQLSAEKNLKMVACNEISVSNSEIDVQAEKIHVKIFIGHEYDGKEMLVLHKAKTGYERFNVIVEDGSVCVDVTSLSPFFVFQKIKEKKFNISREDNQDRSLNGSESNVSSNESGKQGQNTNVQQTTDVQENNDSNNYQTPSEKHNEIGNQFNTDGIKSTPRITVEYSATDSNSNIADEANVLNYIIFAICIILGICLFLFILILIMSRKHRVSKQIYANS